MKYLSKEAAIENTKKFFSKTEMDAIDIEEAYIAWDRDLSQTGKNKGWLSNKMINLKYHNLVKPLYAIKNSRKVLDKIQLTLEGKRAIGRIEGDESVNSNASLTETSLSISDVMRLVSDLRKSNPDYEITFDVKLKNE